jgi:hypothetical protein
MAKFKLKWSAAVVMVGLLSGSARAEIIPELLGFKNVEITKVEPDGIRVSHKDGVAKIKFEQLPFEFRKRFDFNEKSAERYREETKRQQEASARLHEVSAALQEASFGLKGRILQVTDGGVLMIGGEFTLGRKVEKTVAEAVGRQLGTGTALSPESRTEYRFKTTWVQPSSYRGETLFVVCDTTGLTAGGRFSGIVFPAGTYSYDSVGGDRKTVEQWTTFPDMFTRREGLADLPDSVIESIEKRLPGFSKIPRLPPEQGEPGSGNVSMGTGVVIGDGAFIVTCQHVIKGSKNVRVFAGSKEHACLVVHSDESADIAVLKLVEGRLPAAPINRMGADVGESVFTMGFPNPEVQGTDLKLTDGSVSSLSGVRNDRTRMQITVPVQPGNSGGPLFNMKGQIIGIITSKLAAARALKETGSLPENVNYAVKATEWYSMLERVGCPDPVPGGGKASLPDLVRRLRDSVVMVEAK